MKRLVIGLLVLAGASSALNSAADTSLAVQIHPAATLKDLKCGGEIIDVGVQRDDSFAPDLALLQDRYDASYPYQSPRVRVVYDYRLKGRKSSPSLPPVLLDSDSYHRGVVVKMLYDVAFFIASSVSAVAGPAGPVGSLTLDQFVQSHYRHQKYLRARGLYSLRKLWEKRDPALFSLIDENEIQRLLVYGENFDWKSLLIQPSFEKRVFEYQRTSREINKTEAYNLLLFAIRQKGYDLTPLCGDFVLVSCPPNLKCDVENERYLDFNAQSTAHNPPHVPLGIFSLTAIGDKALIADFVNSDRVANREHLKFLDQLAQRAGILFLPFPFSLVLRATDDAVHYLLGKAGKQIFADTIQSQAELAQCLNSGMAELDPEMMIEVKNQLAKQNPEAYGPQIVSDQQSRRLNVAGLDTLLAQRPQLICEDLEDRREREFRANYLNFGERMWRSTVGFLTGIFQGADERREFRRKTVEDRHFYLKARELLNSSHPELQEATIDQVRTSLMIVAQKSNPQDVRLIAKFYRHADGRVRRQALEATLRHGSSEFIPELAEFLREIDPVHADYTRVPVLETLQTIGALPIENLADNMAMATYVKDVVAAFEKSADLKTATLAFDLRMNLSERIRLAKLDEKNDLNRD